jgi:ATP-binding protein involved in chromosome partitioning
VPLNASVASGGDAGKPIALDGVGTLADIFASIAERVVMEISPPVEMAGCSARLLERVEKALGPIGA